MLVTNEIQMLYATVVADVRLKTAHISIYMALLYMWQQSGCRNPVSITRAKVMALSHVQSFATYHRYIRDLDAFGYVRYMPNYNSFEGSFVYLCMSGGDQNVS